MNEDKEYIATLIVEETYVRKVHARVEADSEEEAKQLFGSGNYEEVGGAVSTSPNRVRVTDISKFTTPTELRAEREENRIRWAQEEEWRQQVNATLPEGFKVFYSVGIDPSKVAIEGQVILRCDWAWIQDGCNEYQSEVLTNPTWFDVAKAADRMIEVTGDHHHVFLEAVRRCTKTPPINGVPVYQLSMGS